jgi:hypothetical protein
VIGSSDARVTDVKSPLAPLRHTRSFFVSLAVLFAVLVGLHLHGFSISAWRDWIDRRRSGSTTTR